VLSFHATKVFNTFEGGAIICPDAKTKQRIDHLKNFGFVNELTVVAPGINGKMSEINAAFGMLQLKHVDAALARRAAIGAMYREGLAGIRGLRCALAAEDDGGAANYSYFPILVDPDYGLSRDGLYDAMKAENIYARRYFYPLITDFPMYRGLPSAHRDNLPAANQAAARVLCLPIYPALTERDVERVIAICRAHG
jgi:dTDP-4-amino-4,6-dideoxygalactose transaminase